MNEFVQLSLKTYEQMKDKINKLVKENDEIIKFLTEANEKSELFERLFLDRYYESESRYMLRTGTNVMYDSDIRKIIEKYGDDLGRKIISYFMQKREAELKAEELESVGEEE